MTGAWLWCPTGIAGLPEYGRGPRYPDTEPVQAKFGSTSRSEPKAAPGRASSWRIPRAAPATSRRHPYGSCLPPRPEPSGLVRESAKRTFALGRGSGLAGQFAVIVQAPLGPASLRCEATFKAASPSRRMTASWPSLASSQKLQGSKAPARRNAAVRSGQGTGAPRFGGTSRRVQACGRALKLQGQQT